MNLLVQKSVRLWEIMACLKGREASFLSGVTSWKRILSGPKTCKRRAVEGRTHRELCKVAENEMVEEEGGERRGRRVVAR